jgi:osmoprotectant transport system ATP-binding protein
VIELQEATKRYPDGTVAVDGFTATFPAHRTTVLVGSSGSGKTTILRMINRMVELTAGRILIDGEDVADRPRVALRRSIGYVMQNSGLLPHRRVLDNIATVPRLNGTPRAAARERALELMDRVGLDRDLAERYPHQLSGGQQQRVGVARGLAADPEILLMDEPFGAVDPLVRRDLQDQLIRLQSQMGKTIVFVTHDIDEAFRVGDQIILLGQGGVVAQRGTGPEILAHPADDFVAGFLGLTHGDRDLHIESRESGDIVVDANGRAAGLLAHDGGRAPAR